MTFALSDVSFAYSTRFAGRNDVFTNLRLVIESGECLGVIGNEGAGKTTLLQLLDGLLKPEHGTVCVDGEDVWKSRNHLLRIRRQIGFGFQFPEQHFFCETVEEEVMYGPRNFGLEGFTVDIARRALEETGLAPDVYLARSPFTLSMGEARRVALASLLTLQPRAILLDEPTVGLDGEGIERVLAVMEHARRRGATLVVVSHDLDILAGIADRIIVLSRGILADEPARGLLTDAIRLAAFGYDPPEVVRYAHELRQRGMKIPHDVVTVEEISKHLSGRPI
jgi:energy-coupling factor transport system ATP-binding protein